MGNHITIIHEHAELERAALTKRGGGRPTLYGIWFFRYIPRLNYSSLIHLLMDQFVDHVGLANFPHEGKL